MKEPLGELLQQLVPYVKALLPGALGATVAVAVQQGLTWLQRFVQLAVGIIVAHYAGEAASELIGAQGVVKDGLSFTAGVAAFETAKSIRTSIAEVAKTAPKQAWDWWLKKWDIWFGPKK